MIDLSANPDAVLTLEHGTIVTVNSIEFKFEVSDHPDLNGLTCVFLTTTDSRVDEFNDSTSVGLYADFIKHLRDYSGRAAMLRYELAELIQSNEYEVD